ncbi:microcin C transport system substrate-binding protein [Fluviicoccus keumensis]|uniref:Microcin C transport system substrate-binding protein n=1 Tax=Fluviicoccus keumensis TaxID=1435465 RepID=A0A4Q7YHS0_9GAMM|nr:extracellular solute-binding protein [Fluviicoccus keumensis]RZU37092.1 microcin C transport system substrate-binding protein [Fluviicoccus keumensis]
MNKLLFATLMSLTVTMGHAAIISSNAIALHGKPTQPDNFKAFPYARPDAPKGGELRLRALGTFDSTNPFINKGNPVEGTDYLYDSLTVAALDEPFARYGLLADRIDRDPEDPSWITYHLNPAARFSDGSPVTADDVVFTFDLIRKEGAPNLRNYYNEISKVEALDKQTVKFSFKNKNNRELSLIVGEMSILPKQFWSKRTFNSTNLDIPIGSGPYLLTKLDPGKSATYTRNPKYWAANLPVNRGKFNFDTIKFVYYQDMTVAFEGFKAGQYDFLTEFKAKTWATEYTFPAVKQGLVKKVEQPNFNPAGMQGFVYNLRRPLFQDRRVRQALSYAFDFEWSNRNLFFSAYSRSQSYFDNSELAATGLPSPAELALLNPLKAQVPPEVFTTPFQAPKTDGSGNVRANLMAAQQLLQSAGWTIKNGKLVNAKNEPFKFEILLVQPEFVRIVEPFTRNLARLGIEVSIRPVDSSQYINRERNFDFDMVVEGFAQSLSPGNEQRGFWGSQAADTPGSHNLAGLKSPAVDVLVDKIVGARSREDLVTATRALDRVLLWNHLVIPQYHNRSYRLAYWDFLEQPAIKPKYSPGIDFWWANAAKQARIRAAQGKR